MLRKSPWPNSFAMTVAFTFDSPSLVPNVLLKSRIVTGSILALAQTPRHSLFNRSPLQSISPTWKQQISSDSVVLNINQKKDELYKSLSYYARFVLTVCKFCSVNPTAFTSFITSSFWAFSDRSSDRSKYRSENLIAKVWNVVRTISHRHLLPSQDREDNKRRRKVIFFISQKIFWQSFCFYSFF
jgi:hypothetical protein